jgi:hypothetical protein
MRGRCTAYRPVTNSGIAASPAWVGESRNVEKPPWTTSTRYEMNYSAVKPTAASPTSSGRSTPAPRRVAGVPPLAPSPSAWEEGDPRMGREGVRLPGGVVVMVTSRSKRDG